MCMLILNFTYPRSYAYPRLNTTALDRSAIETGPLHYYSIQNRADVGRTQAASRRQVRGVTNNMCSFIKHEAKNGLQIRFKKTERAAAVNGVISFFI
jgi:hypothetical protein